MGLTATLIRWYSLNKRDLPFRKTKDPYKIWLSEVILQQTRVRQGLPYYEKFIKLFPTIHHLARAKENVVMKAWQGLGYYSRARNLHFTAKYISKELNGKFPNTYDEIIKLKGIGDYTAGAIASFAFNKPHVVVDGNVFRVLSRYFGIKEPIDISTSKEVFKKKAEELLDRNNPGEFNQAMMEFGALQCTPQNPDCNSCQLKIDCYAYTNEMANLLPIKLKKIKVRDRYFNYLVLREKGKIVLKKRTEKDIWKNLYDFPLIETKQEVKAIRKHIKKSSSLQLKKGTRFLKSKLYKHPLSHQTIYARFWIPDIFLTKEAIVKNKFLHIYENQIGKYALPRLIDQYLSDTLA